MSVQSLIFAPDLAETVARRLFPKPVAVAVSFPWEEPVGLWPEETRAMARASDKRCREFAAGRRAARGAMQALGVPEAPVPLGTDRAPVWPGGLTGSISHNDQVCLAVIGHATEFAALGLDVEDATDLPRDLWPEILTPMESAWLSVQPGETRGQLARLIFSAKECAYKAQYPLTGRLFGFDTFEITPDLETGQFEATLTRDIARLPARTQFAGRFAIEAGLILTGIALPATMAKP